MLSQAPLPVLDFSLFLAGGQSKREFLNQLREAARTVGFFYLTGHGLESRQRKVLELSQQFFALPLEHKQSVEMKHSRHFRGYTRLQGELTGGAPDQREQFDIMNEEYPLHVAASDPAWWNITGPNQWPDQLPFMRSALLEWQQQLCDLSVTLLQAFAEALHQTADIFDQTIAGAPYTHMKLIRYPGSASEVQRQGVGAHKDPGYLTLLSQDTHSGLQVESADGWIDALPIKGSFVVNIGELLELASNGFLRATNHRVVSPGVGIERLSCAFFMAARLESEVPLLKLPADLAAKALGPASDPNNPMFYQVGENVLKGRLRSHPDVAAAHYNQAASAI